MRIRERIANAAAQSGRRPEDVTLVAVSKTQPQSAVEAAIEAGQLVFGENRVQEAAAKFLSLRATHPGLWLHLIGPLQTNKARDAVRLVDTIESLDRTRLADALTAAIEKEGRTPTLLVEVNVGHEPQKAGVPARRPTHLFSPAKAGSARRSPDLCASRRRTRTRARISPGSPSARPGTGLPRSRWACRPISRRRSPMARRSADRSALFGARS